MRTPLPASAQSAEQQSRWPVHGSPETPHEPRISQRCVVASQPPSQQSAPVVQISPPARQVSCVEQRPEVQNPLQQFPLLEHVSPSTWQPEPAVRQVPPMQMFEQHCAFVVHAVPVMWQVVVSLQTPPTQPVEQQSAAVVHVSPPMRQPPTTSQRWLPSTLSAQRPEQQSAFVVQSA